MVFMTGKDKWSFIVDEIKAFHDVGRPILVGTTSVEKSETLSKMLLNKHAIQHEVLNAKQHEREAHIVENAGQLGAVMIATNMAGRGTDIKLGLISREALLEHWLKRGIAPRTLTIEATEEQLREAIYRKLATKELGLANKKDAETMPFPELEVQLLRHWAMTHTWLKPSTIEKMKAEHLREELDQHGRFLLHRIRWFKNVEDLGGLHVIGTERHEARRIDNQLRGRSGRQGDKGSSRFFVSFEDDLMKLFAGERTMKILSTLGMKEGDAIEHPMVSKNVERAQRKVEERNFMIRKNILEYDEVMEHQRQRFYGLRQRVLEGRDVKGLLFEYIGDAVDDAVATYLDPEYPAQCAAEFAKEKLDCSIAVERLRGKHREDMERVIRSDAKYDARHSIDLTLGEYMPMAGSEISVDFDSAGLINWARTRFGVEIDAAQLREGGEDERRRVRDMLAAAAERAIDAADLSGLDVYAAKDYGATQFAEWVQRKFAFQIDPAEVAKAHRHPDDGVTPASLVMKKAEELYKKREIEYPVDFAMEMTSVIMRQGGLQEGAANLVAWANGRFGLDWKLDVFKLGPQKIKQDLLDASTKFVSENTLEKEVATAQACKTDAELEEHFKNRFKMPMPESMRYLEGEERTDAIRSRVENTLRAELLHFERTIVIETLDSMWKDHLYAMDQLRDSINFRAFSQQDPRIEYKREGSHMFVGVLQNVRDRVTDYIFKAKLSPTAPQAMGGGGPMPSMGRPAAPRPLTMPVGAVAAPRATGAPSMGFSAITGPGLDAPPQPPTMA
jgi:preprotein translocase subunit SecA